MHVRLTEIADWIQSRVAAAGARGLVVALDGRLDSSVVAALCRQAMPEATVGLVMPGHGNPADATDARLLAERLGLRMYLLDARPAAAQLTAWLQRAVGQVPAALEGLPAAEDRADTKSPAARLELRLRMASLYYVANSLHYLVAGSLNRCDLTIGHFTKYGDGGADLLPIGSLLASEVRALASDLALPDPILAKPFAEQPHLGRAEEGDLGFTYADLERYLGDGPAAVAPALALRIERLIRSTAHKRAPAPTPDTGWT